MKIIWYNYIFPLHDSTGADTGMAFHVAVSGSPINGTSADDNISGTADNDNIFGHEGNDAIDAGTGDDRIHGGHGADLLNGGLGHDVFHYNSLSDSNSMAFDTISDFTSWNSDTGAGDKIDLVALHTFGIVAFTDLTITQDTASNETIITANDNAINSHFGAGGAGGNGGGNAAHTDFEIHLKGLITLHQEDFSWG